MKDQEKAVENALNALAGAEPDPDGRLFQPVPPESRAARPDDIGPEHPQPPHVGVRRGHGIQAARHGFAAGRAELSGDKAGKRLESTLADVHTRMAEAFDPAKPRNN